MSRLALAAALLLTTACGRSYGATYEVDVSPDFTPAETETVLSALDDWSNTVPVAFRTAIVSGLDCSASGRICIAPAAALANSSELGLTTVAADQDGGNIHVLRPITRQVVGHEIGHAMGLEHSPVGDGSSIMFPGTPGAAQTPQCSDIVQWYGLRGRVAPNCQSWPGADAGTAL